eukprot:TRINITY_DN4264_c0_g1_i1.p2 TRINITY_DN4264_c0_g1~~TRINITY_DN4264_c0_g1_i1.p2  ORF type:complete len:178 (-),score=36.55 TRINITY_DN4264_c0_g1_i1:600-1133(-)
MKYLLVVLAVVVLSQAAQQCNYEGKTQDCPVQLDNLKFDGLLLKGTLSNPAKVPVGDVRLVMKTEGYGCVLFFCGFAAGPTLDDPACSWPGLTCQKQDGVAVLYAKDAGYGTRDVEMDFTEAIKEAQATSGCCDVSSECGCQIRGTATFIDKSTNNEYGKVDLAFACNSAWTTCTVV